MHSGGGACWVMSRESSSNMWRSLWRSWCPRYNFYRQVDQCIDLSFVRDLAGEFYSKFGRPSMDPVVFFRLQLIAFFEGICSERQLMETVNLNPAHRWFIGYDLDEPVPDHSSLYREDL